MAGALRHGLHIPKHSTDEDKRNSNTERQLIPGFDRINLDRGRSLTRYDGTSRRPTSKEISDQRKEIQYWNDKKRDLGNTYDVRERRGWVYRSRSRSRSLTRWSSHSRSRSRSRSRRGTFVSNGPYLNLSRDYSTHNTYNLSNDGGIWHRVDGHRRNHRHKNGHRSRSRSRSRDRHHHGHNHRHRHAHGGMHFVMTERFRFP